MSNPQLEPCISLDQANILVEFANANPGLHVQTVRHNVTRGRYVEDTDVSRMTPNDLLKRIETDDVDRLHVEISPRQ